MILGVGRETMIVIQNLSVEGTEQSLNESKFYIEFLL